ncbi:hypothetical protein IMSAG192_01256 [Muribaculaceae bacterium]|nr:hypothetical protein IMSAG192_01256 [Muribaculaceae bacterium]
MPGRVVFDISVGYAYQIAAHGHPALGHIYAHARGLKHSASFKRGAHVIAKDTHIGDFASGMKARRYGGEQARTPHPGKPVHRRSVGNLKGSQPSEAFYRLVGHSVAKYYYMLHLTFRIDIVGKKQ